MHNEAEQADLLAAYQAALANDPEATVPSGLDPQIAALARRLVNLRSGESPAPTFVTALARRLALPPTVAASLPTHTPVRQRQTTTADGERKHTPNHPRRRIWAGAGALASVATLIVFAIVLAFALPTQRNTTLLGGTNPTPATAGGAASPTSRATFPATPTTSCVGTLAPVQPATPPARPIPATPTGREAEMYIPCAFERDPGLTRAEQLGLVQHVNLTQDGPGGTVTIERFYADTNRIVVAYTIRGMADVSNTTRIPPFRPTLTDSTGRTYPYTSPGIFGAFGGVRDGQPYSTSIISFEAASLPADTQQETFRLTFDPLSTVNSPVTPGTYGPWVFDLTMPVVSARVADVGQTVVAPVVASYQQGQPGIPVARCNDCPETPTEGIAISVERIVTTVSETRIYLRLGAPPIARQAGWEVRGIAIEDKDSPAVQQGGTRLLPDGTVVVTLVNPLYQKQGEWTLTIHELWALVPPDQERDPRGFVQVRLTGEWEYRFIMP